MTASKQITQEVTSWPGVEAGHGSRGEFAFKLGRREIGHLHGDRTLHLGFPKAVWQQLYDQGRIDYHPVFPGKPGYASRLLEDEDDVRDAIALLRLNYERAQAKTELPGLLASAPEPLPFAPSLEIRAFTLQRDRGDIAVYSTKSLATDVSRHYLNHRHEAMFLSEAMSAPVFVHEHDRGPVAEEVHIRGTFSRRHMLDDDFEVIPTPGHTPGATAYLWDSGKHRFLFTGDTIFLKDGEWVEAMLDSSDRESYIESLELIKTLDFDVLVPWAASHGGPHFARTESEDTRRRVDKILDRLR